MRYRIQDYEAGNEIEDTNNLNEAIRIVNEFVKTDKNEETYKPNFYAIYDTEKEETVFVA